MRARKGMALFSDTFGHEVCEYLRNSCKSLNFAQSRLFAYSMRFNSVSTQSETPTNTGSNPVRVACIHQDLRTI